MKISVVPIGDEACGSSRIRCFRFLRFMPPGHVVDTGPELDCDVLYIQKIATAQSLGLAKAAKAKGIAVVYDIDDDFGVYSGMDERGMTSVADVVTVDCVERRDYLLREFGVESEVVSPAIDYLDRPPEPRECAGPVKSVVTFGNNCSLESAGPFLLPLKDSYATAQIGRDKVLGMDHLVWSLETFARDLRAYDVCFLAHHGQRRCANRLMTAMGLGMPTIVGPTPSFTEIMQDAGYEWLVCRDVGEVRRALERLSNPAERAIVSSALQSYAWERFHPASSSLAMLGVFERAVTLAKMRTLDADRVVNFHGYRFGRTLYDLVRKHRPAKVVELGTGRGFTAIAVALALKANGTGKLSTWDTWEETPDGGRQSGGVSMGAVSSSLCRYGVNEIVRLCQGDYRQWLTNPEPFDLLYLDIDNDGDKLRAVYEAVKQQLDAGAVMVFEGGTEERDKVPWMKDKVPMRSVHEQTGYSVVFQQRPGLSVIRRRKPMVSAFIVFGDYDVFVPYCAYFMARSYPEVAVRFYLSAEPPKWLLDAMNEVEGDIVWKRLSDVIKVPEGLDLDSMKSIRWLMYDPEWDDFDAVYVGDVDIMTVKASPTLREVYESRCDEDGLPYGNELRTGFDPPRLTGLHYMRRAYFEAIQPVLDKYRKLVLTGKMKKVNNESVLYHMVREAGLKMPSDSAQFGQRRHAGIHLRSFASLRTLEAARSCANYPAEHVFFPYVESFLRMVDCEAFNRLASHIPECQHKALLGHVIALAREAAARNRKKVLVVIDEYGWAFEFFARGWKGHSRFDIDWVKHDDATQDHLDRADVVFVMSTVLQSAYACSRLRFDAVKSICGVRSAMAHEMPDPLRFAAVVANSKRAYDIILKARPGTSNVYYVKNAIDDTEFAFSAQRGNKVGWAGSPQPVKRVHLLDSIAVQHGGVDRKSDWGRRFFVKGRSRTDQVEWLGSLGCYVQVSESEGMSQALMEAVACGVPVVATDVGDTRELVGPEWLLPVKEKECVAQANEKIDRLLADPELASRVVMENRRRFDQGGWSWRTRAAEMDRIVNAAVLRPDWDGLRVLTVVVSTYNQREFLGLCLRALARQTCQPKEVIVADDGSTDGTLAWLDSLPDDAFPFSVRYVTRAHESYRLASLNNLAAQHATGARVLFTNADVLHVPMSVQSHSLLPDEIVGAGVIRSIAHPRSESIVLADVEDFGRIRMACEQAPSGKTNLGYMESTDPNTNPIGVWGGNFSVSADTFRRVGGYDEGFDVGWGGEENDLVKRCVLHGATVRWTRDSVGFHLDHPIRVYAKAQRGSKRYCSA